MAVGLLGAGSVFMSVSPRARMAARAARAGDHSPGRAGATSIVRFFVCDRAGQPKAINGLKIARPCKYAGDLPDVSKYFCGASGTLAIPCYVAWARFRYF